MKERCPICGFRTIEVRNTFEICPVCFWEDGGEREPDEPGVLNDNLTPNEARANYQRIGAISERLRAFVRLPTDEEKQE